MKYRQHKDDVQLTPINATTSQKSVIGCTSAIQIVPGTFNQHVACIAFQDGECHFGCTCIDYGIALISCQVPLLQDQKRLLRQPILQWLLRC